MNIFVSHASKDNQFVKKIIEILDKEKIEKWVDYEKIGDGEIIPQKINKGLSNSDHFLLIWSKNAFNSPWVGQEITAVLSNDYDKKIKKIIFRLDDTPLPPLLAGHLYHHVNDDTAEQETRDMIKRHTGDLFTQMNILKKQICDDYTNTENDSKKPIVGNFRKFDGFKYYVNQPYVNLLSNKKGKNISNYVLELCKKNLAKFNYQKKRPKELENEELKIEQREVKGPNSSEIKLKKDILEKMKKEEMISEKLEKGIQELEHEKEKGILSEIKLKKDILEKMKKEEMISEKLEKGIQELEQIEIEIEKIKQLRLKVVGKKDRLQKEIETEKLIPIVGDYGSGKSALCHHILYKLCEEKSNEILPIFIPLGDLPKHDDFDNHLREDIYDFINSEYELNIDKGNFLKLASEGKLIFILDALDEMSDRLDSTAAQMNLSHVIDLAKDNVVLLTSRHTYISVDMEQKFLFAYDMIIKILDFSIDEVMQFLGQKLEDDETRINEINQAIEENKIGDLSKKPLFLNVICQNFDELKNYFLINESVILEILTEKWIKHDVLKNEKLSDSQKNQTIDGRQRISEILALIENEKDRPIGIEDIKIEIEKELRYEDADIQNRLSGYYKDARDSTFLTREENDKFKFILRPVMEYFLARRIINDIKKNKVISLLSDVNAIKTEETFEFIKGLIDINWAVKSHVTKKIYKDIDVYLETAITKDSQKSMKILQDIKKILEDKEDKTKTLLEIISETKTQNPKPRVSNLLKILHMTGNLLQKTDLRNLNLSETNIPNIDLRESDLRGSDLHESDIINAKMVGVDLRGANLNGAKMVGVDLRESDISDAKMVGVDLTRANLSGLKCINIMMRNSHLGEAILRDTEIVDSDLTEVTLHNSHILRTNLSGCNMESVNLTGAKIADSKLCHTNFENAHFRETKIISSDLQGAIFNGVVFENVDFTESDLSKACLSNANLEYTNFSRANLSGADLSGANLSGADLSGANLSGADLSGAIVNEAKLYGANLSNAKIADVDLKSAYR